MKPGIRTTEFWITAIVMVANLILASGVVAELPDVIRVINVIVAALAPMVYTGARAVVKKEEGA